jgi:REP element-mobilizing transposase RayT
MARPLRIEFENALYHLCARGNERQKIFRDERDRLQFLELLERSSERYHVALLAFVLMSNHFHLVARTHRANLSRWMHWLMVSYTVYFNWRHQRSGHLFQGRYKSFLVESAKGDYLLGLSRYLHLNPVRGKMLGQGTPTQRREKLRRYAWSSYPGYAGLRKQFKFVEEAPVLEQMGGGAGRRRRLRYRRFVEEGLLREIESPWEMVRWQTVLGSESFVRRIQDRMQGRQREGAEVTGLRQRARPPDTRTILKRVAQHYHLPVERLQRSGGYGLQARNVAMWLVWEKCGMSLREIGELFGGLKYSAVAQRLRRLKPQDKRAATKLISKFQKI